MPSQVDLDDLEPDAQDKSSKTRERKSKPKRPTTTADKDLRNRLVDCFERIADSVQARGDEELAEVVRDDAEIMSQGLVSLTRPFATLRTVVVGIISVVEPALAFGRVLRVLLVRWADRRAGRGESASPPTDDYTVTAPQ